MRGPAILIALLSTLALTGCIDPANYRTDPVQVSTKQGVVVCQLYTTQTVLWDEAISAPPGMSIEAADAICKAEGRRNAAAL